MLEVIPKLILLFFLFVIAWSDYKTQLVDARHLAIGGALGFLLCTDWASLCQAMGGALLGVAVLGMAWCSRESIGFGDGWLFVVTGIFLGFLQNLVLLFGSLIIAGTFAIGCLALKKREREDSMALGPFVLMAYVAFVL